jgi:hypothetical protein
LYSEGTIPGVEASKWLYSSSTITIQTSWLEATSTCLQMWVM